MRQEHSAEDHFAMRVTVQKASLLASLSVLAGCSTLPQQKLERFEYSQAQMGLDFRITMYAPEESAAEAAAKDAYARIAQLNSVLSDYDSDSELSKLSHTSGMGKWQPVSPDLWHVLEAGQLLAKRSNGAFDLTVGPSVNLWRRARRQHKLPSTNLLEEMRDRVGYQNLLLDPVRHAAMLTKQNMRLDAGGIAKGFALDEALKVLIDHGLTHAMIHAGGDMVFGDSPPDLPLWEIQLPNFVNAGPAPVVELKNCALATSGDLNQFVEIDGVRYSHIVDPRTGVGLTNRSLVHVIAPHATTSDSLSTAISVLGPQEGPKLLNLYPGTSCQITVGIGSDVKMSRAGEFQHYLAKP